MKAIKKFALIELGSSRVNDMLRPNLSLGDYSFDYYAAIEPDYVFDSEEEAVEAAFKRNAYGNYIIVSHISFDNF